MNEQPTPVLVLTGCLGSGKTTLLSRILAIAGPRVAVLVNEFGEAGIDHHLIASIAPDAVVLDGGCLCCTVRGELRDALVTLLRRRDCGAVPGFDRIVLETAGLAEPAPIVSTLIHDRELRFRLTLAGIVTVVDCLNAPAQQRDSPEWAAQVAAADCLVLSKGDLAGEHAERDAAARIVAVNAIAAIVPARAVEPTSLLVLDASTHGFRTLSTMQIPSNRMHLSEIRSLTLTITDGIDWQRFALWLSLLLYRHGDRILRVKGLLHLTDAVGPVAINGVQHAVHPPIHLARWPDDDRHSRLVFITRGIDPDHIRRSFDTMVHPGHLSPTGYAIRGQQNSLLR